MAKVGPPVDLSGVLPHERPGRVAAWHLEVAAPWVARARAEVEADPTLCAARFAWTTGRCCCCARRLDDVPGRVASACTGCRGRLSGDDLAELVSAASWR